MFKLIAALMNPRLQLLIFACLALALQAFVWLFAPAESPVVAYKLALAVLAALVGLFFDFAVFPFARPDSYLRENWILDPDADNPNLNEADYPIVPQYKAAFFVACLRRALLISVFVLAVALGL